MRKWARRFGLDESHWLFLTSICVGVQHLTKLEVQSHGVLCEHVAVPAVLLALDQVVKQLATTFGGHQHGFMQLVSRRSFCRMLNRV